MGTFKVVRNFNGARFIVFGVSAIILAMYFRLFFGVDTSDEGFSLTMSYLFSQGGQPFINEWTAQQGAAVIFAPFVKIYISLIGSTDGLVLFGRHSYFVLSATASWKIWRLCRHYTTSVTALFPAILPIIFHPGGIPNINYNSLGALSWLLGLGLIYSCYIPLKSRLEKRCGAFLGATFLVIASYSYPSLMVVTSLLIVVSFSFPPYSEQGEAVNFNADRIYRLSLFWGLSFLAIPLIYVIFSDGLESIITCYKYASASPVHGGGWSKISGFIKKLETFARTQ